MIWSVLAVARPEAPETSAYWWFFGLAVYGFIAWLLWSDEKPTKTDAKKEK